MATGANLAVANAAPTNARAVRDVNFVVTVALPNAANTANTNVIDFWAGASPPSGSLPYATTQYVTAFIGVTTLGNGANNKNINVVLMDSADNVTFTNVVGFQPGNTISQFTDGNGAGYAVANKTISLPPGVRRYLKVSATGEANGGNAANGILTFALNF